MRDEPLRTLARTFSEALASGLTGLDLVLIARTTDLRVGLAGSDPLVVVVDGDRERLLRRVLADHVLVEEREDLAWLRQLREDGERDLAELLLDDLVAQLDALVADVHAGTSDELLDLLLRLPAEGALQQGVRLTELRHGRLVRIPRPPTVGDRLGA
jgi:hypothetical protein